MDCPRCGGVLDRYRHGDREAASCPDCGWTGVSADHRAEAAAPETWGDALQRFHRGEREKLDPETLAEVAAEMGADRPAGSDGDGD